MRLINADELYDCMSDNFCGTELITLKDALEMIDIAPTVNAVILPCKVGDTAWVDVKTLPYNYLHPCDGAKDFAKCEVIGFSKTKKGEFIKMKALYRSRMYRRGYLRYHIVSIGKTVFVGENAKEEAKARLKEMESEKK